MHNWIRIGSIAVFFLMAATLFVGAEDAGKVPLFPPPWDKAAHFIYYATMAVLLAHGVGRRWFWLPLVLVPLVGAADEWHQMSVPGRDASIFDWIADALGTVVAVYVYYRLSKRREERGERKGKVSHRDTGLRP